MDIQVENSEAFFNSELSPETHIPAIILTSPNSQSQLLQNITYKQLQQAVSQQIHNIVESEQFRKDRDIQVNFGLQSDVDPIVGKQHLAVRNKQQTVKGLQEVTQGLENAQTIQEIDYFMNKKREDRNLAPEISLIPLVKIEATRKAGFYAKMNQQFNEKGFASFGATLGYWNPFKRNDKIEVNYEGVINEKVWRKFSYQNYALKWIVPGLGGSFQLEGAHSFSCISRGLYQSIYHFNPKYAFKDYNFGLEIAKRSILIDTKSEGNLGHFSKNYMQPSNKISVKLNKELVNSIVYNSDGIPDGESSSIHLESTLPYVSEAQFIKLDYDYRRYFDLYMVSRSRKNQLLKKMFANSSFQMASSLNATLKRTRFVSDFLRPLTLRGFETSDMPNESSINFKTSLKWNIHNFPLVSQARIRAFLFYQGGLSFERLNQSKLVPSVRSSAGWGFSFPMNNSAHLQVIYNLFQHQINSTAKPINFQVRIGFND